MINSLVRQLESSGDTESAASKSARRSWKRCRSSIRSPISALLGLPQFPRGKDFGEFVGRIAPMASERALNRRHCEKRSDEATSIDVTLPIEIASLRSQ